MFNILGHLGKQIKSTLRVSLITIRMAITKKTATDAGEDVGTKKPLFLSGGNVNLCSQYGNQYGSSLKN
jgi:hypothetical protein